MDLGQVDVANIIAIVVISNLPPCPVMTLDLENISGLDGCKRRDIGAGRKELQIGC